MMAGKSPVRSSTAAWRVLLALLCVLLVIVAGTAQSIHMHADGTDSHANCSLCATAHVSVHVAPALAPSFSSAASAILDFCQDDQPSNPLSIFALFTRPPPAA